MRLNALTPWRWNESSAPARTSQDPYAALQREMNQLFEGFFDNHPLGWISGNERQALAAPKLDVSETDKELHVTAELPGVKEEDIDVELAGETLRIRGEKKDEREEKGHNFHRVERSFGAFERVVPIPAEVDRQGVQATFKNGVLEIKLPKLVSAPSSQKITVKRGA